MFINVRSRLYLDPMPLLSSKMIEEINQPT